MDSLMHLDLSGCSGIQRVPQSFGKLKLSYLDLSNCSSLMGVSEFLGNLNKLKHLNLSYCRYVEKLGNLGSLTELQYFKFSSSCAPGVSETDVLGAGTTLEYLNLLRESTDIKTKRLPEATGSFTKLKYLNLSGWEELEELPRSWGSLQNLIHLDLSKCSRIKGVIEALGRLTKLQYLNLSRCFSTKGTEFQLISLKKVVGKLTQLGKLYLLGILDSFFPLRKLYLEVVPEVECQIFLASVSSLSNLEELDLSNNCRIKALPENIGDLRNLHTLNLTNCWNLSRLPRSIGEMDNLKNLNISDCHRLDKSTVPKFDSSLILLPQFQVQACNRECRSNLVLLQNVDNITYLEINKLENVVTIEEAKRVGLNKKEDIDNLMLKWTRDARRFVEDRDMLGELEPPRKLEAFRLHGYNSVAFPAWLMNFAPHHLPTLKSIYLVDLPNCTCLPPLGQLPLLRFLSLEGMNGITKIDGEFCGGAGAFRSLKRFNIYNMENLEEWQTKYSCSEGKDVSEFMFPMLRILDIHHCPKLSLKPCPPNELVRLENESSDNVISSWPVGACAASSFSSVSVETMVVKSCKLPLHQWRVLHHLASHSDLTIDSCSEIGSCSTEITRALSSLERLVLNGNDDRPELPNWMGELTSLKFLLLSTKFPELKAPRGVWKQLTSLRSLTLHNSENITSLPEWLGDLPALQELSIENCPSVNNLEGIMDERFTSLQEICIGRCNSIKSLPESIHRLTNLVKLQVEKYSELEKWCESEENKTKLSHVLRKCVYHD